jgi:two-component system CheB/CheR fusion protein
VKNMLTNVRTLARRTLQRSRTPEEFVRIFDSRLDSLSRTQDLLLRSADDDLRLGELVRLELETLGAREGEKFAVSGADIRLPANAAQAMAMTIHELASNAAEFGALAAGRGRIEIAWRSRPNKGADHLRFHWREYGVALPADPPRKGFGARVIERSLPYLLGGSSELSFHPDGVECVIDFPLPAT